MQYKTEEVLSLLKELEIPYKLVTHKAVYTMQEMEAIGVEGIEYVAKNLFVRDDKKKSYYIVTVQKDKRVDLKTLRNTLASRPLSLASEEDLMHYLALEKGAVTPLGILNDVNSIVTVIIDKDLQNGEYIGMHPNENTASVWFAPKDLERVIKYSGNTILYVDL